MKTFRHECITALLRVHHKFEEPPKFARRAPRGFGRYTATPSDIEWATDIIDKHIEEITKYELAGDSPGQAVGKVLRAHYWRSDLTSPEDNWLGNER